MRWLLSFIKEKLFDHKEKKTSEEKNGLFTKPQHIKYRAYINNDLKNY
jgi:hypothetical protein